MHKRQIWPTLKKDLDKDEAIVITGPRQVGKTTTAKWLLSQIESENKLYFDLENTADRDFFNERDYNSIINKLELRGINTSQKMYLSIDEIQLLPNIPSIVKYLYDHYKIKFILTGSSSYYLKNRFSESLAGRKFLYEMFPLSFSEFLNFQEVDFKHLEFNFELEFSEDIYNKLKSYYEEYIEFGGLPKVALTGSKDDKLQIINQIYNSYINLDVQTLADFSNSENISRLIKLLARRVGSKINTTDLAEISGMSRPTIDNYLDFLEQTYVIKRVEVFSKSEDVKQRKQGKIYFVDTGIASINADLSGGAKFENTVAHQLSFHGNLNYFESKSGEIDFVLNNEIAFEVKETPVSKHQKLLQRKSKNLGLEKSRLIGRFKAEKFDDLLWGGMIV